MAAISTFRSIIELNAWQTGATIYVYNEMPSMNSLRRGSNSMQCGPIGYVEAFSQLSQTLVKRPQLGAGRDQGGGQ